MTFNIGSQTGGVINNVGGDQQVTGGQQGAIAAPDAGKHSPGLRSVAVSRRM